MIEAVILDWAGTTVDYGCFAPVETFMEVFKEYGIEVTMEETREPMGMLKWEHINYMLSMPRINKLWEDKYGRTYTKNDVDEMYKIFEKKMLQILDRYVKLKPFVLETVEELRKRNIRIGSTTGYNDAMMEIVTKEAAKEGYEPDIFISPDSTKHVGRPFPYMIFKNMEELNCSSVDKIIKIGDTVSDIQEGRNAGVKTVGVVEGSSVMGLTKEEFDSLTEMEKSIIKDKVRNVYKEVGADYIIENMKGLIAIIDKMNMVSN